MANQNENLLLAVVHEYLQRKDKNLANVFKSKCTSVNIYIHVVWRLTPIPLVQLEC